MNSRLISIDLLRTFSIFTVLMVHVRNTGRLAASRGFFAQLGNVASRDGSYGVTVFFVISGFLISRMIQARYGTLSAVKLGDFYRRRAARILPLLAVALGLGLLLVALWPESPARQFVLDTPGSRRDLSFWVSVMAFFFNWHRILANQSFGLQWDVLWSLSIEEQFYVFYPLFLVACATRRRLVATLAVFWGSGIVARVAMEIFFPSSWLASFTNSFTGFEAIALGCLVFVAHQSGLGQERGRLLRWMGAISLVLAYTLTDLGRASGQLWGPSWVSLSAATLLLGLAGWTAPQNGLVRWLARPGQLSYGIYLWHALAIALCWSVMPALNFAGQIALVAATAWLLATLSARWIEEPLYRLLTKPIRT